MSSPGPLGNSRSGEEGAVDSDGWPVASQASKHWEESGEHGSGQLNEMFDKFNVEFKAVVNMSPRTLLEDALKFVADVSGEGEEPSSYPHHHAPGPTSSRPEDHWDEIPVEDYQPAKEIRLEFASAEQSMPEEPMRVENDQPAQEIPIEAATQDQRAPEVLTIQVEVCEEIPLEKAEKGQEHLLEPDSPGTAVLCQALSFCEGTTALGELNMKIREETSRCQESVATGWHVRSVIGTMNISVEIKEEWQDNDSSHTNHFLVAQLRRTHLEFRNIKVDWISDAVWAKMEQLHREQVLRAASGMNDKYFYVKIQDGGHHNGIIVPLKDLVKKDSLELQLKFMGNDSCVNSRDPSFQHLKSSPENARDMELILTVASLNEGIKARKNICVWPKACINTRDLNKPVRRESKGNGAKKRRRPQPKDEYPGVKGEQCGVEGAQPGVHSELPPSSLKKVPLPCVEDNKRRVIMKDKKRRVIMKKPQKRLKSKVESTTATMIPKRIKYLQKYLRDCKAESIADVQEILAEVKKEWWCSISSQKEVLTPKPKTEWVENQSCFIKTQYR